VVPSFLDRSLPRSPDRLLNLIGDDEMSFSFFSSPPSEGKDESPSFPSPSVVVVFPPWTSNHPSIYVFRNDSASIFPSFSDRSLLFRRAGFEETTGPHFLPWVRRMPQRNLRLLFPPQGPLLATIAPSVSQHESFFPVYVFWVGVSKQPLLFSPIHVSRFFPLIFSFCMKKLFPP